jgi:radical SAM family RiPP maturation amino acid epimerase
MTLINQQQSAIKQQIDVEEFISQKIDILCHVKRFNERWQGDKKFREQLLLEPQNTIDRYDLKIKADDVKYIWDSQNLNQEISNGNFSPTTTLQCVFDLYDVMNQASEKPMDRLEKYIEASLKDNRFKLWRKRQVTRLKSQTCRSTFMDTGHYPCAFELSKGCSVGCWFCSLSAASLESVFPYDHINSQLWKNLLSLLKNKLGDAVLEGFCYCATDPLDNPDYEKFTLDFYNILGSFPQTTTAQAWKYPERVRSLIKMAEERGGNVRFSVLSLKHLNLIHEQFTAEELAGTELILQLEGSLTGTKSNAGRARALSQKKSQIQEQVTDSTTPACISGFLFNMVNKTVQLMSPCLPSDRWIHGHRIHDEASFKDLDDLEDILENMMAKHMPVEIEPDTIIRFRSDLEYQNLEDGFQLSTQVKNFKFTQVPYLKHLGSIIAKNQKTAQEIAMVLASFWGISPKQTYSNLNHLFNNGFLDDGL